LKDLDNEYNESASKNQVVIFNADLCSYAAKSLAIYVFPEPEGPVIKILFLPKTSSS
jgi:hypothetical protein